MIAAQLASNALSNIAPGGGPVGAALQYRIFVAAGLDGPAVVSALTAVNLLVFAVVLGLPVLAIPGVLRGSVNRNLLEAAAAGLVAFAVIVGVGRAAADHRPAAGVGGARRAVRPEPAPPARAAADGPAAAAARRSGTGSPRCSGARWKRALAAAVGRWLLDFMTLLAALAAIGSHPRPSLVLLAFCAAKALGNIPITPGGLGFVEAGMTALLALAGVDPGDAVLATFAYRLFSYWLPLPFGLLGMALAPRRAAPPPAPEPAS